MHAAKNKNRVTEFFRSILKFLLVKPLTWAANKFSSAPKKEKVYEALSRVYESSIDPLKKNGAFVEIDPFTQSIIIFSDQHKGGKNAYDDFAYCEKNYLAALDYYEQHKFYFVNLGDSEELWKNNIFSVMKHNKKNFHKEKFFIERNACCKIIGNHDLFWRENPIAQTFIKKIYQMPLTIFEGVVLRIKMKEKSFDIFATHGHQGDAQSDGNAFSKWFVSFIWGPLQAFLQLNPNTPSCNDERKTLHNQIMYEWSAAQKNLLLITGHTHQPVFNSLTHLERLYLQLEDALKENNTTAIKKIEAEIPRRQREYDFVNASYHKMKPSYFNTGCCCFRDGTITGIEIADGAIRLIKWSYDANKKPLRIVAEEMMLEDLVKKIEE